MFLLRHPRRSAAKPVGQVPWDSFGGAYNGSVFEAVLTRALFDNLVSRIGEIIVPATDSVSIYPLCASCAAKSVFLGLADRDERPGKETVFIV